MNEVWKVLVEKIFNRIGLVTFCFSFFVIGLALYGIHKSALSAEPWPEAVPWQVRLALVLALSVVVGATLAAALRWAKAIAARSSAPLLKARDVRRELANLAPDDRKFLQRRAVTRQGEILEHFSYQEAEESSVLRLDDLGILKFRAESYETFFTATALQALRREPSLLTPPAPQP
jgi:hypothetical protein